MKSKDLIIDFDNSIAPWLGKTSKLVDYYLQEELNGHGLDLSKEQMIVLIKLHDKDGLNQNELAFLTFRDKSSLTRLLSKMEQKKYITREQSTLDKRINNVYLTELGKEMFRKTKPVMKGIIDTMEQNISEAEKRQIIKILQKVQFNFTSKTAAL